MGGKLNAINHWGENFIYKTHELNLETNSDSGP
jgi:hypothetical protein